MFNLADYEPVEARLARFIEDYPEFRIATELESMQGDRFIVKAYLYRHSSDVVAFATGYAEETVSDRGVNSTSALENCETSAIGRALANAGYAAKGKRPSQSEMAKVNRPLERPKLTAVPVAADTARPAPSQTAVIVDTEDYWNTPFGDGSRTQLTPAPKTLEQTIEVVDATIDETAQGAWDVPQCDHGDRRWQEGEKNGRAWGGFMCGQSAQTGGFGKACDPMWYVISSDGTWKPQAKK